MFCHASLNICQTALNVALDDGVGDLKLGLFLILASFLMKVAKTVNGGNDTKRSCLYFVPCVIHFSCRPNGSLSTMGWIPCDVSRYSYHGIWPPLLAESISERGSPRSRSR